MVPAFQGGCRKLDVVGNHDETGHRKCRTRRGASLPRPHDQSLEGGNVDHQASAMNKGPRSHLRAESLHRGAIGSLLVGNNEETGHCKRRTRPGLPLLRSHHQVLERGSDDHRTSARDKGPQPYRRAGIGLGAIGPS